MSKSKDDILNDTITPRLALLVACATGYLSFNGYSVILNEMSISFHNTALASIMAVASSILIWLAWAWFFKEVERRKNNLKYVFTFANESK